MSAETPITLAIRLTLDQATTLYDLAAWALDADQDQGDLWQDEYLTLDRDTLRTASRAIILGGGSGRAYL